MRLSCDIEIVNRVLASHNLKKPCRHCHAQISIGRKPSSDLSRCSTQVFLMVCTAKDRNGLKYLLKDNVSQVFVRFVNEGKATIRFKHPEQDLCLCKADPLQLKAFLSVVRTAVQGKDLDRVTLSSLAPASCKNVEKPKTELHVVSRKEYPITSRFPSTLEILKIHLCSMKRIDPRILHLSKLHSLDLSHNCLIVLPDDWGKICCLTNLVITDNKLTVLSAGLWTGQLCHTLVLLNVRNNMLTELPLQLCELKQLKYLNADKNCLKMIPPTIGKMNKLVEVLLSGNNITVLPAGFAQLRLDNLDVSDNPFDFTDSGISGVERLGFPTLVESVARSIRKYRIPYTEEDLLPVLYHYLGAARQCWCGNYCFSCSARYVTEISLRQIVASYTSSPGVTSVPIEGFLCSQLCYAKFQCNPRAYWRS